MLRRGRFASVVLFSTLTVLSGVVRAQDPPGAGDESADVLFENALKDMEAKKLDRACPALRKSYKLDPRPRVLYHLAKCEDESEKIATALAIYDEYLALFDRLSPVEQKEEAEREELAVARREALLRDLPKVTLKLPDDAPAGTTLTRESREGVRVPLALNVPLPVDPGEVIIRVQAPGRPDWDHRFFVMKGEKKTVDVPVPPADKRKAQATRIGKPLEPVPSYLPPLKSDSEGQKIGAYVAAGVGIVGIAVGAVTGLYTLGQKEVIETSCRDTLCNPEGEAAKDAAATYGLVSTVTFVVGGAALAAGVVLFVTAPAPAKLSAIPSRIAARPTGVEVTWQW